MTLSSIIYYSIIGVAFMGIMVLHRERYRLQLEKAKRWRMALDNIDYRVFPPFRFLLDTLEKGRQEKADIEIYEAISSFERSLLLKGSTLVLMRA